MQACFTALAESSRGKKVFRRRLQSIGAEIKASSTANAQAICENAAYQVCMDCSGIQSLLCPGQKFHASVCEQVNQIANVFGGWLALTRHKSDVRELSVMAVNHYTRVCGRKHPL